MSRILRRPMFRGGGKISSYNKGITSGLANGGRPGYLTGGEILKSISQNFGRTEPGGKVKVFGKSIPGTGVALDKEGKPYDPKYFQEQLKGTRDELNSMLSFLPAGRSIRGLNMLRSGLGTARSGLPSASKVKDFFTKSPLSKSKEIGPYKPQPIGTDAWLASKIRPAFQNTGVALKDMLGGAGKLKDYKAAIGIGGIGGGIGLAKGYDAWKERQQGVDEPGAEEALTEDQKKIQELQKLLEEQTKLKVNQEQSSSEYKETVLDRKERLKKVGKEYEEILGDGIKKDSIFDAMVEGGTRLVEGQGWAAAARAANESLDPIQNIKTAARKLAIEEDIALRKAKEVAKTKVTDWQRREAAMKRAGKTDEQIGAVAAGEKDKDLPTYIKESGTAGYMQYVNDKVDPESVIVGEDDWLDVDTSKLKNGVHYIKDAFTLIVVEDGKIKGEPTFLR